MWQVVDGCGRLLMDVAGGSWVWQVVDGCGWLFSGVVGCCRM